MVGALRKFPWTKPFAPDATKRFLNLFACRTERASSSAPSAEVNSPLTIRSTTTARIRSRSLIDVRSTCPSSQEEHSRRVTLLSAYQGDVIIEVQHNCRPRLRHRHLSAYPPSAQVILRALKKYGMIVADNGSDWFLSGAPDARWSDAELNALRTVHGRDFEVVRMGTLEQ